MRLSLFYPKHTGYCLLLLLIGLSSGCRKFLDAEKQGEYTSEDYPYPQGAGPYDTFIFGAYNFLRDYNVHAAPFIVATSIRSDDADKGSTPTDGGPDVIAMDNFPVQPNNGIANAVWTGYYTLINRCNSALNEIRNNEAIQADEGIKNQAEAEVRFIRAYGYFMLVRLFGRVPLIDRVLEVSQTNVPQSEPAQIYAFIEADLQFATVNLPANWDPKFIGRATSGAAFGMLSKVYLTQNKWSAAVGAARIVMNSGRYDLSTPYDQIFKESGENSRESVFEVQATASARTPTANGVQYASIQGVRGPGDFNLGWGWNTPGTALEGAYEPGDPRKMRTILYSSTITETRTSIYGETLPVYPSQVPNPMYNNKVYTNPSFRALYNDRGGWWMNVRILRYADVVLIFAEAANELGGSTNTADAVAALNSVRARARGSNSAVLPAVQSDDQEEVRQAIRHERRVEFGMEHDRFFDIVRWGIAEQAMHAAGKANFSSSRDNLLPIPQTQIDLSKGVLTQNPGY
jgi:hypothetical protein